LKDAGGFGVFDELFDGLPDGLDAFVGECGAGEGLWLPAWCELIGICFSAA
jgi:hypothetical protein